jgi:hypothetical protein
LDALDTETTLKFFTKWFGNHQSTCGVARLDVEMKRQKKRQNAGVTHVKLVCPACSQSISGFVRNVDIPMVNSLIQPTGAELKAGDA